MLKILLILVLIAWTQSALCQVGINTSGSGPDSSAMLDVSSEVKGMLLPRMTALQMLAIPNPALGLIVFNTSLTGTYPDNYSPGFYFFNGTTWKPLNGKSGLLDMIPALDQTQIDSISGIAGMLVLNTSSNCLNYFSGLNWMELCGNCTPQPTQALAGSDQVIIGNSTVLSANTAQSGTGSWQIIQGTGGAMGNLSDPLSTFTGTQPGSYVLRWTISSTCGSSQDDVTINFQNDPPPVSNSLLFAPYADCTLWPNFQIENFTETGNLFYTCAFLVDNQGATGANPCWGGYSTLLMDYYQDKIAALRSQGGDVIISFGGANGVELSYAAANEYEARDAYKSVIDAYSLSSIDFDIEGLFIADPNSILRRSKAMKLLQNEYPALRISLTLPVMPTGLTADGLNVVQSALTQNVNLSIINIMAMDYGGSGIDMGNAAISAGEAVFVQIKTLYQNNGMNLPDSVLWRKIGVTPMIGANDVQGEVFYLDDADDLAAWASNRRIGRLSIWSVNRDKPCSNPNDPLYSCSHISQALYEFSGIFNSVAGSSFSRPSGNTGSGILPKSEF